MFTGRRSRDLKARLESEAETARSNEYLARRFVEHSRATQTILPGITVIERLCADALVAADRRIDDRIVGRLDGATRDRLDALLTEDAGGTVSRFVWLRQLEVGQNSAAMNRLPDQNRGNTNTQGLRGIRIRIIGWDCKPVAEARDANGRPGFVVFGATAHPVESDGQFPVGPVSAKPSPEDPCGENLASNAAGSAASADRQRAGERHRFERTGEGIKGEGEGEWNARKHGGTKRRVWRKIHIGIDERTLEIRAAEVTRSDVGDAPMLPELLDQIPPDHEIASVTADGAYDTRKCHDAIAERGADAVIPPRKNAKPWKSVTAGARLTV